MKRLLLNGSPRGKESNSRWILGWIAGGLAESGAVASAGELPVMDLARAGEGPALLEAFMAADEVVLAFPLYTDSAPALVKRFLEEVSAKGRAALQGKRMAFVVQSGFPESIHSETTAKWLARYCARYGLDNRGIAIRGGIEGIRIQPESMYGKVRDLFVAAGRELAGGGFSGATLKALAGKRRMSPFGRFLFSALSLTGITNFYWDMMLRKHGAFGRRFDAPYGEKAKRG